MTLLPPQPSRSSSASLRVAFHFVLLQHGPSCHFLGSAAIAARLLGTVFYVFIFALFLGAYASKMFISWHDPSCLCGKTNRPSLGRTWVARCNLGVGVQQEMWGAARFQTPG